MPTDSDSRSIASTDDIVSSSTDQSLSSVTRRRFLAGTGGGLAGLCVLGRVSPETARAQPTGSDWTQYDATAAHGAYLPKGSGPSGDITTAWENDYSYLDRVAVVDDTVYIGGKHLVAVDAATGNERWRVTPRVPDWDNLTQAGVYVTAPASMDGTVYAAVQISENATFTPRIIAIDAASGKRRWQRTSKGSGPPLPALTASDGTLFTTGYLDGTQTERLYAIDAATGNIRWKRARGGDSTTTTATSEKSLPVANGRVYMTEDTGISAVDTATGNVAWTALSEAGAELNLRLLSLVEDTLFVTAGGEWNDAATFIAFDAVTGSKPWRKTHQGGSEERANPAIETVDANTAYVNASPLSDVNADILALKRIDRSERWRATIPVSTSKKNQQTPTTGFARVGELLYVGGTALDPADGSSVWKKSFSTERNWELIAVAGGRAYLRGMKDDDPTSGKLVVLTGKASQTTETAAQQPTTTTATDTPPETGSTSTTTASPTETSSRTQGPTQSPTDSTTTSTNQTTGIDGPGIRWGDRDHGGRSRCMAIPQPRVIS